MAYAKEIPGANIRNQAGAQAGVIFPRWAYTLRYNCTNSSGLPADAPTATDPAHADSKTDTDNNMIVANLPEGTTNLLICPYGTDAADETFNMRVTGWKRLSAATHLGSTSTVWIPIRLWEGTCTLHTPVGVANAKPNASDIFCDSVAQNEGVTSYQDLSDTVNSMIRVDNYGHEIIQISFNVGTAASANALMTAF